MNRFFYWLTGAVMILDIILLPWVSGWLALVKFTLAVLPFIFVYAPLKNARWVFALSLIFFKTGTVFNFGVIFAALAAFYFFERHFLVNFFHKSAWQTLALSSLGPMLFFLILFALSKILTPEIPASLSGFFVSGAVSVGIAAAFNFLMVKVFKKSNDF